MKAVHHLLLIFALVIGGMATAKAEEEVDLELVLAVDASGSVSFAEYRLQLGGIASAFLSERVQRAIRSGPRGKIAVALVIWSDHAFPKYPTNWYALDTPESAKEFASVVANFQDKRGSQAGFGGGGTGIGGGVAYAIAMMEKNGFSGTRRVIDVSGDGVETKPWFASSIEMPQAREMARLAGITINGLAIKTDFRNLDEWYREHVIHGPGSFVMEAADFTSFAEAMEEKLWREIVVVIGDERTRPHATPRDREHAAAIQNVSRPEN